ncbi:MAG: prephenate dehydratase [Archaeoglobaceae archaeon]|nr:prephenate dehydratase [Archaeoglobaceae archaeon]MCX8152442.1 prephenate dehydratase [Archaeoglobaceae archaeon]MDW8013782.1 prephenate dehydratase [Archaeoglobaceae archaeon]
MKILIYGMGSMGKFFYKFFKDRGYKVESYDIDEKKRTVNSTEGFDVTFLCVPMQEIENTLKNLDKGCLVVDLSSIKSLSVPMLKNYGFDFLSLHPLFGGDAEIQLSNVIVVHESGRMEEKIILDELRKAGAVLSKLSPEEHDELMKKVQGFVHFALIALAEQLKVDEKYLTLISNTIKILSARILSQNWEMYYKILRNSPIEDFIKRLLEINEILKDKEKFKDFFEKLAEAREYDSSLILEVSKIVKNYDGLENLRNYIKIIDLLILKLIEKRIDAAKRIAKIKAVENKPVEIKEIEEEKFSEIVSRTNLNPLRIKKIFEEIIRLAKEEEYKELGISKKVAILGPMGSFSEEAALKLVKSRAPLLYCSTVDEVVRAVESGEAEYGIVPIENSVNGTVLPTLDALIVHDVEVFGEMKLEVIHCLVAKNKIDLKSVKKVFSHPQAIAQCMNFINNYLPHAEIKYTLSTSDAVNLLDDFSAAIMSENAARLYKLHIIRKNIQDLSRNITRFYIVRKRTGKFTGKITALFFGVEDRPGALKDVLEVFARKKYNLRKLESRPARTYLGDYIFFAEVEAPLSETELKEIRDVTTFYKIVGVFEEVEELVS